MFHILRKFRKCNTKSTTFQLVKQLMHAKNRQEYRKLFNMAKDGVRNEEEL